MNKNENPKKSRQHFVSQSYPRNFSPDLIEYQDVIAKLDKKGRQKIR